MAEEDTMNIHDFILLPPPQAFELNELSMEWQKKDTNLCIFSIRLYFPSDKEIAKGLRKAFIFPVPMTYI